MYFVVIDLNQLWARLVCNRSDTRRELVLGEWLRTHGFRACETGWIASPDAIHCLSCSEIIFSERADQFVLGG